MAAVLGRGMVGAAGLASALEYGRRDTRDTIMIVQGMDTAVASSSEWPVQPERYAVVQVGLQFNPLPAARARIEGRTRKAELVQTGFAKFSRFETAIYHGESASQKAHILQSDLEFTVMTSGWITAPILPLLFELDVWC